MGGGHSWTSQPRRQGEGSTGASASVTLQSPIGASLEGVSLLSSLHHTHV